MKRIVLLIALLIFISSSISLAGEVSQQLITKDIMIIIYNPVIESQGGKKLNQVLGWFDPDSQAQEIINQVKEASKGHINYQIVERIEVDGIPQKADGFNYTDETYLQCWYDHSKCHSPDGADYYKILSQYDICTKVNSGEIDELWIWGGPWFGYWESALTGPNGFWYNGPTYTNTGCNRLIPIMGFNYERSTNLHTFGHRAEATMTQVFDGWNVTNANTLWNQYGNNRAQTTNVSYYGCGSIHWPFNARSPAIPENEYRYDIQDNVSSNCDDWLNYPNFKNETKQINCKEWGCNDTGYYIWWFNHLPHFDGEDSRGILNNWWVYISDPNTAISTTSTTSTTTSTTTTSTTTTSSSLATASTTSTTTSTTTSSTTIRSRRHYTTDSGTDQQNDPIYVQATKETKNVITTTNAVAYQAPVETNIIEKDEANDQPVNSNISLIILLGLMIVMCILITTYAVKKSLK